MSTWEELIQKTTVKDLLENKNSTCKSVVLLQPSDSLKYALETLRKHNIISAPVVSETGTEEDNKLDVSVAKRIVGFVDVLDIAGYILSQWSRNYLNYYALDEERREESREDFFNTAIRDLLNYSGVDFGYIIRDNATLSEVIEKLSAVGLTRIHRLLVVDEHNQFVNILSQSDVVSFINQNIKLLPNDMGKKSVKELGLIHSAVMVSMGSSCYHALEVLYRNRFSGIAIVNFQGEITANLSASDLLGMNTSSFDYFSHSVLQFLINGTKSGLLEPVTCREGTTLTEVLNSVATKRIHRLHVVNHSNHPSGVITLTDIIQLLGWKQPHSSK